MAARKLLVDDTGEKPVAKKLLVSDTPAGFQSAYSGLGFAVIRHLAQQPDYPARIARVLGRDHQAVYYHIRRLEHDGLVKRVSNESIRGGKAGLYSLTSDGFAVEYDVAGEPLQSAALTSGMSSLGGFLREYVTGGRFSGWIVVGSPEPHGPNRTQGRDGHYAVQLGFALGRLVSLPERFPVRLDVDARSEHLLNSNLIVVGGPRTNTISSELNDRLPVRFSSENFWGSITDETGRNYFGQTDAIVAKVSNPWDGSKSCVVVAGLTGAGTKAAVIGMTNRADLMFESHPPRAPFGVVLSGVDLDGDGKVDSVEVLHRA